MGLPFHGPKLAIGTVAVNSGFGGTATEGDAMPRWCRGDATGLESPQFSAQAAVEGVAVVAATGGGRRRDQRLGYDGRRAM